MSYSMYEKKITTAVVADRQVKLTQGSLDKCLEVFSLWLFSCYCMYKLLFSAVRCSVVYFLMIFFEDSKHMPLNSPPAFFLPANVILISVQPNVSKARTFFTFYWHILKQAPLCLGHLVVLLLTWLGLEWNLPAAVWLQTKLRKNHSGIMHALASFLSALPVTNCAPTFELCFTRKLLLILVISYCTGKDIPVQPKLR